MLQTSRNHLCPTEHRATTSEGAMGKSAILEVPVNYNRRLLAQDYKAGEATRKSCTVHHGEAGNNVVLHLDEEAVAVVVVVAAAAAAMAGAAAAVAAAILVRGARSCSKDKFRLNWNKLGNILGEIRTPTTEGWKHLINIKLPKTSFTIAPANQVLSHGHLVVPFDRGPRYCNPFVKAPLLPTSKVTLLIRLMEEPA